MNGNGFWVVLATVGTDDAVGAGLPKGTRKISKLVFAVDDHPTVAVLTVMAVAVKLIGAMVQTGVVQFTTLL